MIINEFIVGISVAQAGKDCNSMRVSVHGNSHRLSPPVFQYGFSPTLKQSVEL